MSQTKWMEYALKLAKEAAKQGEIPIGAVIVSNDTLISTGFNRKEALPSPLGHAEMIAIHRAAKKLNTWRLSQCELYTTLEPCVMCAGTIIQARIPKVFIGALDPKGGAAGSSFQILQSDMLNHRCQIHTGLLAEESSHLIKSFFKKLRHRSIHP